MQRVREKTPLLHFSQITKEFSGKGVLRGLTFYVFSQEVLTINGQNGAGKSTLLRLISGLSQVSRGSRTVIDEKLRIGYVPDRFPKLNFTVREYAFCMGKLQRIPDRQLHARIEELLQFLRLDFAADQRMTGYSKGMLQKANIMQAILQRPGLLLLDEPLAGLDRKSQHEFVELVGELKQQGVAIVLTTHQASPLESMTDRIITLANGLIASDVVVNQPDSEVVMIEVCFESEGADIGLLKSNPGILHSEREDGVITLQVRSSASNEILRLLLNMDGSILSVNPIKSLPGLLKEV